MIFRDSAAALLLVSSLAGCSSIPDPPTPFTLAARPTGGPFTTLDALGGPRAVVGFLTAPPPPPLPFPLPRIEWWPERPRQASVVALRIEQPAGPALENLRVRFAGHEVVLAADPDGWHGLGGLPLDSAGFFELEFEFERGRESESVRVLVPVRSRTYPSSRIRISASGQANPELDARIARDREQISRALSVSSPAWIPDAPIRWPRDPVVKTSPFGQRRVFNGSVRSRHMGLDLRAFSGHPIMAPAAGRVALAGRFVYQGNAVYLDHGLGLHTAYFHMSRLEVEPGDWVEPGQVLGRSGTTGRSTAAHLHWSAYVNGRTVDPESLVGFSIGPARPGETESGSR